MDHLSLVLKEAFHDSDIARNFCCRRTKSAALAYNVLGKQCKNELLEDIISDVPTYSIIIDESTDITTTKVLAVAIKFHSKKNNSATTRFLDSVDLKSESAQDLFDALNSVLEKQGLLMKNMIGFAADTTNVMFGINGGVVAKIKEVNPYCVFIKCVCHSVALAVSHACKVFPRSIEQLVKEVYNYFSSSSKRQRDFAEFQKFTNSEEHKILRHHDIRWLSLHACVNRILEQWDALKLYFHAEYLLDKKQHVSVEFLHNCLNDNNLKLYFYFLDFVLPIVNKFNKIFQGDYPTIHRLYKDMSEFYTSLLSCYLKKYYVKTSELKNLDPKNAMYFLEFKDMYLGVKVSTNIDILKRQSSLPQQSSLFNDFFTRCQEFFIELCSQLKLRLPFEHEIFRDLTFLEPHVAVSGEFRSLSQLLENFPNIVSENDKQHIDNEYRTLKFDESVQSILASSNSSNAVVGNGVNNFWKEVGNITNSDETSKYPLLTKLAKQLLCLPVSNVKCERIFSDFNRIKTKDRNKFNNQNISAILHAKEGLRDIGNCSNFNPGINFIRFANDKKNLYKGIKYESNTDTDSD